MLRCPLYLFIALFLCLCSFDFSHLQASEPPKLLFRKQIRLPQKKESFKYKINKGEYLYSILRDYDVPEYRLSEFMEKIKKLNPQIKDYDQVRPGQMISLPSSLQERKPSPQNRQISQKQLPNSLDSISSLEYIVKPGEHVAKILRQKTNLSDEIIFSILIPIFKKMNPHIDNINKLKVGQKINLPIPHGKPKSPSLMAKAGTTRSKFRRQEQKTSSALPDIDLWTGQATAQERQKILAISMLKKMGFRFAPGREMLYPFEQENWIRLNLQKMPLANSPWGNSILFVPEEIYRRDKIRELSQTGLTLCKVDSSWSLGRLFKQLEKLCSRQLIFWEQPNSLILSSEHNVLELQADYQFILNTNPDKSYYLFNLESVKKSHQSALLHGYLKNRNIKLFNLGKDSENQPRFHNSNPPEAENLYLPSISAIHAWPALKKLMGSRSYKISPDSHHFQDVYPLLQEKGLAERKTIRVRWMQKQGRSISVNLPVIKINSNFSPVILLTKEQGDPYLVALLKLKGYNCYVLKK